MNTVAEAFLHYLRDRGITQAHIARVSGIDSDKLNRTFHGRRALSMKEFEAMAKAAGEEPGTLLSILYKQYIPNLK